MQPEELTPDSSYSETAAYFARAGSVVNVCETGKRKARAPISPPGGVSNSMVPRMFAVTGTGPSPA